MLACVVGGVCVGFMCWHVLGMSVKGMRVKSFSRGHAGCAASVGASLSFKGGGASRVERVHRSVGQAKEHNACPVLTTGSSGQLAYLRRDVTLARMSYPREAGCTYAGYALARCITLPVRPLAAVLQRRCSCPSSSRCRVDAAAAAAGVALA